MKKLLVIFSVVFFSHTIVSAQFGLSGGATYILDGDTFGLQGKGFLGFGDSDIRGAGTFTYFLNGGLAWAVDLDAHYTLIEFGNDASSFNPFAGLNIVDKGITTDIGINLGVYTEFSIGDGSYIYIEPKFTVSSYGSFVISAGYKL